MERLTEKLKSAGVIGIDMPVFIYHFENHPDYSDITRQVLGAVETGVCRAVTSMIALLEITVQPYRAGQPQLARKYEALLANFPNLKLAEVDREITRLAAQLRAEHNLRTPDALQQAACLVHGARLFITNDRVFTRLAKSIEICLLDDYRSK